MPPAKSRKIAASRKKKQTRLTFEAVDLTSSPAPSGPSPAKVRYAKPSTSRSSKMIPSSSVQDDSESDDPILSSAVPTRTAPTVTIPKKNGKLPFKKGPLPTPFKSSQVPGGGNRSTGTLEDSEDGFARTSFTPRSTQHPTPKPFSAKVPIAQKSGMHIDGNSSDGSLPENTYTPTKPKGKPRRSVASTTNDNEEEAVPAQMNSGRSSRVEVVIFSPQSGMAIRTPSKTMQRKRKETVTISSGNSENEEEDELPKPQMSAAPVPASSKRSARKKSHTYLELSSSSEELDVPFSLPPKRHGITPKKPTLFSNVPKSRSSSPMPAPASSDNEFPSTRKLIMNGTKKSLFSSVPKGRSSSLAPEELSEEDDSDDDIIMSTQRSRRKKSTVMVLDPVDDDDEEVQISSPLKRRRAVIESDESDIASSPLKRKRPNPRYSEDDEDDLPMEVESSQPPTATQQTRATRQSRRRHRTEKEKMLEVLKRRRAGEHIDELTETEESESEDDSGSELQKLSEFEDEEEEEVVIQPKKSIQKSRRKKAGSGSDQDNYDSDFIEDDDDGNLGVPTHSLLDIPLEFTHAAHKPLKEHFKDAVEWMVHAKINPGFARDDPVYMAAFRKLDDEYGGYAKSKFVSTQWTAEFVRAIYARPEFLVRDLAPGEEMTIAGEVICQVCNHRKYVPKYEIQFAGKAYHRDSLEEVEQDDSSDDSDGASKASQKRSVNADGQVIPSEERCWLSGRFCKANAEQAHSLIHWKYALNQWVLGNLEQEGYLTPERLAEREKLNSKKRRKYANDIVDEWESHRQIKDLYRDFKINLETARNSDSSTFKGGRYGR